MNGLLFSLGITMIVVAVPAILQPQMLFKESLRNRNRRLEELRNGAPEFHFEERRELESYRPRYNPTNKTIRVLGFVGLAIGFISVFLGTSG